MIRWFLIVTMIFSVPASYSFAINTVADGYRVVNSTSVQIDAHSQCRNVTNNSGVDQFVATKSSTEWSSFYASPPTNMSVNSCGDPCEAAIPAVGATCSSGAIYAGTSNGYMYMTTPGGCSNSATPTCTGTDTLTKTWGADGTTTGQTSLTDGAANSAYLAANYGDTNAAKFCENMTYAGFSDWFLPAETEWDNIIAPNYSAIGGFDNANYYWMSNELSSANARGQRSDGSASSRGKNNSHLVRCVRKSVGHFVITSTTYNGNRGGLAGANGDCLTNLQAQSWMGKSSAGTLTSGRVKAFMCTASTCNDALPNIKYNFARAGNAAVGGASFTANSSGQAPNDSPDWKTATYFDGNYNIWTGRANSGTTVWPSTGQTNTCNDWSTSSSGVLGARGEPQNGNANRWYGGTEGCHNSYYLVCFVHP